MPGKMKNYGGDIPSPRQSYDASGRRPSGAGGDRDARSRALMARPEMAPMIRPGMPQEEIDMYNKPQMDINDAFFGPDNGERFDIIAFISNLLRGGR